MKTTRFLLAFALGILLTAGLLSAAQGEPPVIAAVRADNARVAAMVAGDAIALGKLLSDQLRFVHSDGRVESKGDYVKNLMAGDTAYADAGTSELETMQIAADVPL